METIQLQRLLGYICFSMTSASIKSPSPKHLQAVSINSSVHQVNFSGTLTLAYCGSLPGEVDVYFLCLPSN